jgi:hypothetical protein
MGVRVMGLQQSEACFQPIFRGLANRNGVVRCRAGDHSLTIDGENPTLKMASIVQTAMANGFFIAVACAL